MEPCEPDVAVAAGRLERAGQRAARSRRTPRRSTAPLPPALRRGRAARRPARTEARPPRHPLERRRRRLTGGCDAQEGHPDGRRRPSPGRHRPPPRPAPVDGASRRRRSPSRREEEPGAGHRDGAAGAPAALAATALAGTAAAGAQNQSGLVNVAVVDNTVQIPVGVAANVCDVSVNILAQGTLTSPADCTAVSNAFAFSNGGGGGGGGNQQGLINLYVAHNT